MAFVYGAIMLIGLFGMIACSKKQRTNPSMQTVAVIIFVFVVMVSTAATTAALAFAARNFSAVFLCPVKKCSANCFFCQNRAVYLCRRKPTKGIDYGFVCKLKRLRNLFAFNHFGSG